MSCRLFNIFTALVMGVLLIPGLSWALDAYPDVGYGRVDGYSAVGRRSAEFLSVPVSARSVGMGDAYTAVVDDISAIHYNPAGLGFLQETEFMFTRVNMPAEVGYNYVAAATPLADGTWVVGGFYGMLSMDPIEETTILFPNGTGSEVDIYSQVLGGTVAYNFSDRFSAGVVVKHVYEDYWGVTARPWLSTLARITTPSFWAKNSAWVWRFRTLAPACSSADRACRQSSFPRISLRNPNRLARSTVTQGPSASWSTAPLPTLCPQCSRPVRRW